MSWYLTAMKKYADFTGRARRKEYWIFTLVNLLAMIVLGVFGVVSTMFFAIYALYCIGILIPSMSVCARRLHDTGRSGWMQLIAVIPLVGAIVLLVFVCGDSAPGDNEYGPNPKLAEPVQALPA